MKRNLFGLLAIVVAIGAVAFTTPKKTVFADVFFAYSGPNFSETEVEKPANWIEVSNLGDVGLPPACSNNDVRACRIKVSDLKTQGTAPNRTLVGTTSIIAAGSASTFYVTLAGDVLQKRNKN